MSGLGGLNKSDNGVVKDGMPSGFAPPTRRYGEKFAEAAE